MVNGDGDQNQDNSNNQQQYNSNNQQQTIIQRIALRIPPFWDESPEIWFAQIEAQFTTSQVTTDLSKFNAVVGAIESKILTQVADAVLNPPALDKYGNLKAKILDHFSDSQHKKMTKLLQDSSLGDQKPSSLLNEMRRLSTPDITDDLLKTLWLKRLPTEARVILSTNTADLPELAKIADKIIEIGNLNGVNSISTSNSSNSTLEKCVAQLTKAVESLKYNFNNFNNNNSNHRSRSSNRSRSKSRGTSRDRSSTPAKKEFENCWYHYKFGAKANKCTEPCKFNTKN